MRVIFAGTPEFARIALQALHAAGHSIALVLTQPDRPAGRGMKLQASAVKQFALLHSIPVAQPRSLRLEGKYPEDAAQAQASIEAADADVMVVAAYGLILPQWVLDCMAKPHGSGAPRLGCINIHGSLLPRWRGAAPIHRAIEMGDLQTGVTTMQMDAGLDTGAMLLDQAIDILTDDTTGSLHDKVAALGADLVVQTLAQLQSQGLQARPQPLGGITYAHKVEKAEAAIDWQQDAQTVARRVRAFNPAPVASTRLGGEAIKVWLAHPMEAVAAQALLASQGTPVCGQIVALAKEGLWVTAMNSVVILTELQRAGGKRMAAADFQRGADIQVGMCFEPAPKPTLAAA